MIHMKYNKEKYMKVSDFFLGEHDVLDRIQYFLHLKHWSLYKLAKEADLPYSSLNNIFNRKTLPTIPTLEKICNGLGVSMSDFFAYKVNPLKSNTLTDNEQDLINSYRTLSTRDKELLSAYLKGLCKR